MAPTKVDQELNREIFQRITKLEADQANIQIELARMVEKLDQIHADFTKARGAYAGIVIAVSVIWGAILGVAKLVGMAAK